LKAKGTELGSLEKMVLKIEEHHNYIRWWDSLDLDNQEKYLESIKREIELN